MVINEISYVMYVTLLPALQLVFLTGILVALIHLTRSVLSIFDRGISFANCCI